jgi:quinol monooxygenase YgiN
VDAVAVRGEPSQPRGDAGREDHGMLIVTARVVITPEGMAEALQISLDHVARSRREPGCTSHSVMRDAEDDHTLFFFEQWADRAALDDHFQVREARAFARRLGELATEPSSLEIYSVSPAT